MHIEVASNHKITYLQLHLEKMRKICQKLLLLKLSSFFPFVFPVFLLYSSPFLLSHWRSRGENYERQGVTLCIITSCTLPYFHTFFHPWVPSFKWQPWCFWFIDGKVCGNLGLLFCSNCNIYRAHYTGIQGLISLLYLDLRP